MSIKLKISIYFIMTLLLVVSIGSSLIYITKKTDSYLMKELSLAVDHVQFSSQAYVTAQLIRYEDEVLTQSARNYAFTGDKKWKERYEQFIPKLDSDIKDALAVGDVEDKAIFESLKQANLALIAMEKKSLDYAAAGKMALAQQVLDSGEYDQQKNIYRNGIERFLSRRGATFDTTTGVSTVTVQTIELSLKNSIYRQILILTGLMLILLLVFIFLFIVMIRTFMIPLNEFRVVAKRIIGGDLKARVNIDRKNEMGEFARDFNQMTIVLNNTIENTEKKIRERTAELEKINKIMVDRELRMVDLKKEVQLLKNK